MCVPRVLSHLTLPLHLTLEWENLRVSMSSPQFQKTVLHIFRDLLKITWKYVFEVFKRLFPNCRVITPMLSHHTLSGIKWHTSTDSKALVLQIIKLVKRCGSYKTLSGYELIRMQSLQLWVWCNQIICPQRVQRQIFEYVTCYNLLREDLQMKNILGDTQSSSFYCYSCFCFSVFVFTC